MKLFAVFGTLFIIAFMASTVEASLCNLKCPAGFECLGFKCVISDSGRFKRDQIPCQTDKDCFGSFCVGGFCYIGG